MNPTSTTDPNAFVTSSQVMKPGCFFMASLINGPIGCGWLLTVGHQLCFVQVSRQEATVFLFFFFFNTHGPVMVDILPQKSTLTATYYVETVLPVLRTHPFPPYSLYTSASL